MTASTMATANPEWLSVGDSAGELRRVLTLARPWRKDLRYGVTCSIAQEILSLAGAAIVAYAAGRAFQGATYDQISVYLLGAVLVVLPQVRLPWLESVSLQAVGNRVDVQQDRPRVTRQEGLAHDL